MRTPWDKLESKKLNSMKGATKPNPFLIDEIGYMPSEMTWDQVPLLTNYINPNSELDYEVKSYPDGAKYVVVKEIHSNLTFKLNSYEDLWILNQIHDVVKTAGWSVTVTIPFLIDSQADRRFDIDQPHGLKLVCQFLNGLSNFNYRIFHPHNAEVVEALLDRVEIIDNSEFIRKVLLEIEGEINN